jgi:hypothetical protein
MTILKDNSTTLPYNSTISGTCSLPNSALSGATGLTNSGATGSANPTIRSGGSLISSTSNGIMRDITLEPISSRLTAIEERLAILTPDLQKLEKYSALKQAYDNYKLLETLCKEKP